MSLYLVAAALAATPADVQSFTSVDKAARVLAGDLQTGTLLFSKGDCLAVKIYTQSPYTHVAAVVIEDGKPVVFDSMNGAGVRRLALRDYLKAECPNRIHVFQPNKPFSQKRTRKFVAHLQHEVGRPYAITHHVTGQRCAGLHCSEYVTDALMSCRLIRAKQPARVSPASLAEGLLTGKLYTAVRTVELCEPPVEAKQGRCWCEQLWFDTVACTGRWCTKMKRVFFCQ